MRIEVPTPNGNVEIDLKKVDDFTKFSQGVRITHYTNGLKEVTDATCTYESFRLAHFECSNSPHEDNT